MDDSEDTNKEPFFSLNDFRKWMTSKKQPTSEDRRKHELIGMRVESKLGLKRLLARMSVQEGNLPEMAREFRQYGGDILEVDKDDMVLIEVNSGTFYIPSFFIKKIND